MSTLKVGGIRGVSASSDAITVANDGTCTANVTNRPNHNIIINGGMLVSQREVSFTVANGSEKYTLDRYYMDFGGSFGGGCTITQSTESPDGFNKSWKLDVTSTNTSIGASDHNHVIYVIEGQDLRNSGWNHLSSSSYITCSFWAKTNKAGTYFLAARTKDGTNKTWFKGYTLTANTWTRVSIKIPGDPNITINDDNGAGMDLRWVFGLGSSKVGTAETWTSNLFYGTSDQTNLFDSTSNEFYLTGIKLEVGEVATDFEHKSFMEELQRCQRYYCQTYNYGTYPGAAAGGTGAIRNMAYGSSAYAGCGNFSFPVKMRTTPTCSLFSRDGTAGKINADGTLGNGSVGNVGAYCCNPARNNDSSGVGNSVSMSCHVTAEAEL